VRESDRKLLPSIQHHHHQHKKGLCSLPAGFFAFATSPPPFPPAQDNPSPLRKDRQPIPFRAPFRQLDHIERVDLLTLIHP
jgi:hypothetical protein